MEMKTKIFQIFAAALALILMMPMASAIPGPVTVEGTVTYSNGTYVPAGWNVSMVNLDEVYDTEPWTGTTGFFKPCWNYTLVGTADALSTFVINVSDPTGMYTGSASFEAAGFNESVVNITMPDTTPPTWDTTIGIQSATDTGLGGQVTVTYGTATDADTSPVKYNVYYNTVSPATDGTKIPDVGLSPYTVTGLTNGQLYYFTVRVEDSATPPNEDTNTVELNATPTAPTPTPTPTPTPRVHRGHRGGAPRDSDGDGILDIKEMLAGTDPNDPCDPNPECAACLALRPSTPTPTPTPTPVATPSPTLTPTVPPPVTPAPTPKPTPTPTPKPPGFEGVFAIAGLLTVAYLVLRRKKR